jgi:peptide/nickel transport system permease protein
MRPGGVVDRASVTGTSFGLAIPNFVLGFFLIQVFALSLGWFPAQGYTKFSEDPSAWLESIILPAFALGVIAAASVARQTRAALIDVLQSNYVRTAFAVGTGTRRTVVKYAFKNASIPTVTVIGLQLAALIGGVVIIEQIFVIPGLGTYMLRALSLPDVPVIQAVTITFVLIYVTLNLIVDISYGYLNPRVRTS